MPDFISEIDSHCILGQPIILLKNLRNEKGNGRAIPHRVVDHLVDERMTFMGKGTLLTLACSYLFYYLTLAIAEGEEFE
jgi:hypothetical protein